MTKKKVINKGYTVEVISWENDGDNYKTKSSTFETLEEAKAVKHMCENLFISNYDDKTLGNKMDDEYEDCMLIAARYLVENPHLLSLNKGVIKPLDLKDEIITEYEEELQQDPNLKWEELIPEYLEVKEDLVGDWWDTISHINSELLGYSEYYFSRVCESCTIFFSPEDVYLEVIE